MCTIAGYAGAKQAAPILVEMMRKEEFMDGGLSTGIATVHEGKLYMAKVTGDVDELLRTYDVEKFPGTVGIIHTRTSGNLVSHAHPFMSEDGELALVENGTCREVSCPEFWEQSDKIMKYFYERGTKIDSAYDNERAKNRLPNGQSYHYIEPYALMIGEMIKDKKPEELANEIPRAIAKALSVLPDDTVFLTVHAKLDNTITLGNMSRPMTVGFGDGEVYLASSAIAFPEEIQKRPIISIPPTTVAQVTPEGLRITNEKIEGTKIEQIDYRIAAYIRTKMEKLLREKHIGVPEMPCYTEWREVWSKPYTECEKYKPENALFKPYAAVLYEALWSFHKEGRLHTAVEVNEKGKRVQRFWLED